MGQKLTADQMAQIPALYYAGESTCTIARLFGVSPGTIKRNMRKLGVEARGKSLANALGHKVGRIRIPGKHILAPNSKLLSPSKAYILGVLCGDGWLWQGSRSWQMGLQAIDKEFVERFAHHAKSVYEIEPFNEIIEPKVKGWNRQFKTRICAKAVLDDISNYGVLFKTETWRVPEHIKNAAADIKVNFLRGFFDSEGNVETRRVQATSTNIAGLQDVQKLLTCIGIRSSIAPQRKARGNRVQSYNLRIQDRKSVEVFCERIGFSILRKQKALEDVVKGYKLNLALREDVKKLEPVMARLRKTGMSYDKIAKSTGVSIGTVWRHLNEVRLFPRTRERITP